MFSLSGCQTGGGDLLGLLVFGEEFCCFSAGVEGVEGLVELHQKHEIRK